MTQVLSFSASAAGLYGRGDFLPCPANFPASTANYKQLREIQEISKRFLTFWIIMKDSDDNDEEQKNMLPAVETSGLPKSAPKTFNQIMESLDESQEETARAPQGF